MITDWRGTEITVGAIVIYAASLYSHSVEMVEGQVIGFTNSGRVRIKIIRRSRRRNAYINDKDTTNVGADNVTVIGSLPDTDMPTFSALINKAQADWERSKNAYMSA